MKIDLCIPFSFNNKINEYTKNKNSIIYKSILDDNLRDWGLFVHIMYPQTDNIIIRKNLALFFRFFYNIIPGDISTIITIIKLIHKNIDTGKLNDDEMDIYRIIKNVYDISDNIKWKKLFLAHLQIIINTKNNNLYGDIKNKILYFGSDLLILIAQLFSPIFLDSNFIFSFGIVILIMNDIYNLKKDNDNFNLNNIYFLYSDNQIQNIINLFNHHMVVINGYSNIYYYKSLIYNFAIWKDITTQNNNINIISTS